MDVATATVDDDVEVRDRAAGRVLVVDHDAEARSRVRVVLARAGIEVNEAESGDEALMLARTTSPTLVLLETCLDDLNGYELLRELREELGDVPVVILSDRDDPLDRTAGLMLGAADYLGKPFDAGELVARVRRLVTSSAGRDSEPSDTDTSDLTPRELEVLRSLALGRRPREIASALRLSEKTVSNYLQRLFSKLGVHSQAQAVTEAYRRGIISPRD